MPRLHGSHLLVALFTLAAASACADTPSAPSSAARLITPDDHGAHAKSLTGALTVEQKKGIARARAATARFHDFNVAEKAGYTIQFPTGCAELPGVGAQAFHYMNGGLVDNVIDLEKPELLMYEPQRDGSLQLVGLDFVVPRPEGTLDNQPAPLLGMEFAPIVVQSVSVWALHIWAWRPNTLGVFTPWNPAVSCQYAAGN